MKTDKLKIAAAGLATVYIMTFVGAAIVYFFGG